MKKLLPLLLLFVSINHSNAQFNLNNLGSIKKEIDKHNIHYNYTNIIDGKDTIRCKRLQDGEAQKLSETGQKYIPNIERLLDQNKDCLNRGVVIDECVNRQECNSLMSSAKEKKIDVEDYENEFNYYGRLNIKKIKENELRVEKENHIRDSTNASNAKQQRKNDSIAEVKRQAEVKKQQEDVMERQKQRRISLIKKYGQKNGELIFTGQVKIGMTEEMCKEAMGEPTDINTTTTPYGTSEQWVYSLKSFLYFENGILKTIQN